MGGMTCLLLLLWAGVTVSTPVDLQKRIYGGQPCPDTERLYHVEVRAYVTFPHGAYRFCGGSRISAQWILTAAHCWDSTRTMRALLNVHPGPEQIVKITEHHIFVDDQGRKHDIMLLKLPNPIPNPVHLVPLPDCAHRPNIGDAVQIAGYGRTTKPIRSAVLQCAETTVVACPWTPDEHMFCAQRQGVHTCPGDSGGGVVFNRRIYGVHKGSVQVCTRTSVFMDVCEYLDWINEMITP